MKPARCFCALVGIAGRLANMSSGEGKGEGEILVVGDIHGCFDETDLAFIEKKAADICLFVGDLGDEDPEVAKEVTRLETRYEVLLGNHDAWSSFRHDKISPELKSSLDILGERHLAYRTCELETLGVTLLGTRPFSWGGPSLRSPDVYHELYGIRTMEESAQAIVDAAKKAQQNTLVILAHNGPTGLGDQSTDIYGKDFGKPGGDWGDLDLQLAIKRLKDDGFDIPLVIAGHMHLRVSHPRGHKRINILEQDGTIYLNPAHVPRIFKTANNITVHHFVSIRMAKGRVASIRQLLASDIELRATKLHPLPKSLQP